MKANYAVPDPRSAEERDKYAVDLKQQHDGRWHGRNFLEMFVNRAAFRMYRKLEKFLAKKGIVPPERPLWFVTSNEPR